MINEEKKQKIDKFLGMIKKMSADKLYIGMLVFEKNDDDMIDLTDYINGDISYEYIRAQKNLNIEKTVVCMGEQIEAGKGVVIQLKDYLDPAIYNQIFLLHKSKHMEYALLEDRIQKHPKDGAFLLLVSSAEELEKLNYDNIFDLVDFTERI